MCFDLFENDYIDFDCAIVAFIVGFAILCLIALINLFINQEYVMLEMVYFLNIVWHDLLIYYWIHITKATVEWIKKLYSVWFCSSGCCCCCCYIYICYDWESYIECTQQSSNLFVWCWSHWCVVHICTV